ncbi:MAG: hypothetical protein COT00_02735 [Candidatus Omnitrophica bacterium CG07_land_8_20_14_0_80_50_8]|nr:MAG: hypothetical protein AUJ71_02645 [Candidatus Omnitrophica bacterium CG1_02_49_16]PIU40236.1 MAG: hypothetical protein COT00_02735 [Candidatus Omnitrophica bacterium CG07_land_8_20_14_0_80_50_8]
MGIRKSDSERRRSVRIFEELPFVIDHQGYEVQAKSVNISNNGVRCLIDRDIPLMTQLDIVFSLPVVVNFSSKEKIVKAKGVIVRKEEDAASDRFFVAIYFSDIKPKDQKVLNEFIAYRLKLN